MGCLCDYPGFHNGRNTIMMEVEVWNAGRLYKVIQRLRHGHQITAQALSSFRFIR